MNKPAALLSSVQKVFTLLFSGRWIEQWQLENPPAPQAGQTKRTQSSGKDKKKKKNKQKRPRRGFYQRIFTLRVTLWYLIFQRLNFDQTLAAVVRDLRKGGVDRLGKCQRKPSKQVQSSDTSGYNQARQRMPLKLLQGAFAHVAQKILSMAGLSARRQKKSPDLNNASVNCWMAAPCGC